MQSTDKNKASFYLYVQFQNENQLRFKTHLNKMDCFNVLIVEWSSLSCLLAPDKSKQLIYISLMAVYFKGVSGPLVAWQTDNNCLYWWRQSKTQYERYEKPIIFNGNNSQQTDMEACTQSQPNF